MELQTPRLTIREFVPDDLADVQAYAGEAAAARFMVWGPNDERQSAEFIQRMIAAQRETPRRVYEAAVVLRDTGRVIGGVGMRITRAAEREGDVGYVFNPRVWGRGYCTEAAAALVGFGFAELKLHRIFATCDPANRASARVLEKLGMRHEGRHRDHLWQKGAWRDSLVYAIIEGDPRPGHGRGLA
jgi:RimJ/RimL family protein N-acetyltransferase